MQVKVFYTPTCGQCPEQKEMVQDVVSSRDDAEYVSIDATQNPDEANKYSVRSVPMTIVEENGEVKDQFIGLSNKDDLRSAI